MWNILFLSSGFCFYILLVVIYFSKETIHSKENKIFKILLLANGLEYVFELPLQIYIRLIRENSIFIDIFTKFYLFSIFSVFSVFSLYTYLICLNKNKNQTNKKYKFFKNTTIIYWIICSIILLALPVSKYIDSIKMYAYGPAVEFLKILLGTYMITWMILLLINIKSLKEKKYLPIFSVLILIVVNVLLQSYDPSILIATVLGTFTCYTMSFTIENPDIKMIEQLNIARDQADKANRAKTDFLSSMSHEIRTPLNAIVGFSECINESDNLEEAKENAHDIVNASQTLLEIVNGILDISKIEAGKIEIHNSAYDAHELFDSIVKLGKGRLGEKPLDYRIHIAEDLPSTLYGDHFNLKKVIVNLLTNAIKYTDHGYVDFSVKCVKTKNICRLIVSVKDSGRGIKKEDIDKLFTKFQRLDEDKNTTIEGTGLGLAITKQLIDLMGGKIIVNSVYGEGSNFTVVIDQKISNDTIQNNDSVSFNDLDLTGKKILIVDDNKLNLKVASKILEKYKPTVDTVESGIECLEKINSGLKYDLILMDDMMPRMNGREALARLKQIEGFNTPVIVLTANAISGMEQKYLNEGFDSYLSKPIDKDALHKALSKFLMNKEEKKEIDFSTKKILIVDDNSLNIKVAKTIMKPYNLNIDESLSGIDCIDKIKKGNSYDLIFMDDMMPEKSGIDTFKELKEIEGFNTPVVILTANAIEGMKDKYIKEGFNDYLSKPIDKQELDRVLNTLLSDNEEEQTEVVEEKSSVEELTEETANKEESSDNNIEYLKEHDIDIEESLKILGDIDTYNNKVKDFYSNIKNRVIKLKECIDNNDMETYSSEIGILRIDSKSLGFASVADTALNHQLKSGQDNIEFIKEDFNNLIDELYEVLVVIKEYLQKLKES